MKLYVDFSGIPSPCRLVFHHDGSFGQGDSFLFLDYEINLSHTGSLVVMASKETGACYCLEGFSWKNFSKAKNGQLDIETQTDGCLCFMLEEGDPIEWGTGYEKEFELSLIDEKRKLVLYGEMPLHAQVVRFAYDQFVCLSHGEITGFIIPSPLCSV